MLHSIGHPPLEGGRGGSILRQIPLNGVYLSPLLLLVVTLHQGEASLLTAGSEHPLLELLEFLLGGVIGDLEFLEADDGAPFLDAALEGSLVNVGVPFLPLLVRRENKVRSLHLNHASLDGDRKRIAVAQAQEHIVWDPAVELVENDSLLALVAVPPDVAVLVRFGEDEGVGILGDCLAGFAGARLSPVDVDLRGFGGVAILPGSCDEGLDSAVEFDEGDGELLGNLLNVLALLNSVRDVVEISPVLEVCTFKS